MGDIVRVTPRRGLYGSALVAIEDDSHEGVGSGRRRPATMRALIALAAAAIALLLLTTTPAAGCETGGCPSAQVTVVVTVRVAAPEPDDHEIDAATASIAIDPGPSVSAATATHAPGVAPVPPPDGLTSVVAGTSDLARLVEAQQFAVATVWLFDVASQRFLVYVVGAPDFASTLTALNAGAIVTFRAR